MANNYNGGNDDGDDHLGNINNNSSITLTAALHNGMPQQTGSVYKLHVATVFLFLPRFVQNWILKLLPTLVLGALGLRPIWKERELVLLGSFLYRFDAGKDGQLKGTPVDITTVDACLLQAGNDDSMESNYYDDDDDATSLWLARRLLPQHSTTTLLRISTLRKQSYYAFASHSDATTWLHSIHDAKTEAVQRSMGHVANTAAVPSCWNHWDALGRSAAQRKERIQRRAHELELRSMGASSDGGGAIPRGYFG